MRADMATRGYSPLTQAFYARAVRHLARHYAGHSLEQISVAEAQSYLRVLKQRKVSASTLGNHTAGLRFLFEVTFGKVWQPVSNASILRADDQAVTTRHQDGHLLPALHRPHARRPAPRPALHLHPLCPRSTVMIRPVQIPPTAQPPPHHQYPA
jgi:hypothetical protein